MRRFIWRKCKWKSTWSPASRSANMRAQGEEMAKRSDVRQHVLQLESQVQALQEWALASAETQRFTGAERVTVDSQPNI
jgi:hypothetical protein